MISVNRRIDKRIYGNVTADSMYSMAAGNPKYTLLFAFPFIFILPNIFLFRSLSCVITHIYMNKPYIAERPNTQNMSERHKVRSDYIRRVVLILFALRLVRFFFFLSGPNLFSVHTEITIYFIFAELNFLLIR